MKNSEAAMYTIYGLCEPFDPTHYNEHCPNPEYTCWWWRFSLCSRIRYIGITDDIYRRYADHLSLRDNSNSKKNDWILTHRDKQQPIHLEILQQVQTREIALIRETYWIAYYHYLDADLLNKQKYDWLPSKERIRYVEKQHISKLQDPQLKRTWHIWAKVQNEETSYTLMLKHRQTQPTDYFATRRCPPPLKNFFTNRTSIQSWKELFEDRITV